MPEALTRAEEMKLVDLEMNIERGMETFVTVAASLAAIQEGKLYRAKHETFEAYCQERWGWTANRARQLIRASEVVSQVEMGTTGTAPATERVIRELVPVPEEKRAEVWETATKAAEAEGKKPTAKHVAAAAAPHRPAPKAKPQSKVDALREQRERRVEERTAEAKAPEPAAVQPPLSASTVEKVPASTVVLAKDFLVALATVPTLGSSDAIRVAEALTEADMDHVRRVRETCQRIMTEYARPRVVA